MSRCLIVDDQEQNLYLLQDLLQENGYEVESALNGAEALEKARRAPPDIVISDALMPVMDGFALCREWRQDERLKTIPFIFYTAMYKGPKDKALALSIGADRFLLKPLDTDVLIREIAVFISKKKGEGKTSSEAVILPESDFLKEYNEVLIRKLEEKMLHLEETNSLLEEEIRAHRAADENLEKSEIRYQDMFTNAVEGIYQNTPAGRYIVVNPAYARMYGYESPQEMIDSVLSIARQLYVSPEEWDRFTVELEEKGLIRDFEVRHKRKDGSPFWISLTGRVIRNEEGKVHFYEGRTIDITHRKNAEDDIREGIRKLQQALQGIIQVLVSTVEQRDPYTAGHQQRVTDLAWAIAGELGLNEEKAESIRIAGLVHDIGKISIPAEILNKPAKLSDLEMQLVRFHPDAAEKVLRDVPLLGNIARIVLEHHERMDGSGYPKGLKGDEILLASRILAVADVVEAMASHRPYRPALGIDSALEEIMNCRGTQFDTGVVDACVRLFREKGFQFKSSSY